MTIGFPVILALALMPVAATAQTAPGTGRERTIDVAGRGKVSIPPDLAMIEYLIVGEGKTADEASRALADRQKAIVDGLSGLLGRDTQLTSGNVSLAEVRGPGCQNRGYGEQTSLATPECVVVGHIAQMQGNVRTRTVAKAGTAVGLAARLGARNARIQQFALSDRRDAERRATAAALVDAGERAAAIAAGSNARLGPVLAVNDRAGAPEPIIVTGRSVSAPAPPPPPAPVEIDVAPRPIDVEAQLFVTYALLPS